MVTVTDLLSLGRSTQHWIPLQADKVEQDIQLGKSGRGNSQSVTNLLNNK